MIHNLSLNGYRGFESFEVPDLKRVNLLVGMNNCGKSSILEALDFLVSMGDPTVLIRPLNRRGEKNFDDSEANPVISHLFHGHPPLRPGNRLNISADSSFKPLTVEIVHLEDTSQQRTLLNFNLANAVLNLADDSISTLGLRISRGDGHELPAIPISEDGSVTVRSSSRFRRAFSELFPRVHGSLFLSPDSLYPNSMRAMWDTTIVDNRESEVVDAMRLLNADIESVHFLTGRISRATSDGIMLGLRNSVRRLPLGSFGDGMRRLLALSLALVRASGGYLLIDEIDTGLHYSVMQKMWNLVVNTAQKSNVQVFATTHSFDCIKGLASLVENQPDLAPEISIQKIESSLTKAVNLDGEQIPLTVRQSIEIR